jgi:hypothetical protein
VTQPFFVKINFYITLTAKKVPENLAASVIKKLPKVNNHPMSENSSNPVTLARFDSGTVYAEAISASHDCAI